MVFFSPLSYQGNICQSYLERNCDECHLSSTQTEDRPHAPKTVTLSYIEMSRVKVMLIRGRCFSLVKLCDLQKKKTNICCDKVCLPSVTCKETDGSLHSWRVQTAMQHLLSWGPQLILTCWSQRSHGKHPGKI